MGEFVPTLAQMWWLAQPDQQLFFIVVPF